jgi:endonuclease YncB( thermonuclease family)
MMKTSATLLFLSISFISSSFPIEISGKVSAVIDGNTIEFISSENETFNFVLAGIDCPELNQEFGGEARDYLEKMLAGKSVKLLLEGKDRFGNRVGSVQLLNGKDPRIALLQNGLAWTLEKSINEEFENLKEEARNKRLGLWKQENPVAPWVFRRQQSMLSPKMG